jgi:O-antigen ligase
VELALTAPAAAAPVPPRPLLLPALLVLVVGGTLLAGLLTPRDLSLGEDAPVWAVGQGLLAYDLSRAVTALVLLASVGAAVVLPLRRGLPRAGLAAWAAYALFVATNFVLPLFAGRERWVDARLLVPPVVMTAAWLALPPDPARLLALVRVALLAFTWVGLGAAALLPERALAGGYAGLLPGLDVRLYGVGGGATSLGALTAAYLALEVVSPSRGRLRWLHLAAAAAALVLTQAKTSWLFLAAVVLVEAWRRWRAGGEGPARPASARALRALVLLIGAAGLGALAVAALGRVELDAVPAGENLATLTGRTYIWATSLEAWWQSPVFGYGLGLWESPAFRAAHGGFDHAHNQLLHALASAGVVGLLGLLAYLGVALRIALRAARAGDRAPLVLLAGLLVLCLTNVPLRAYYVLDAFFLMHLAVFAALVAADRGARHGATGNLPS